MHEPFAAWIERDVVRASGPDTVAFLQGQLSQEVDTLAIGASSWSLLLQPSGKVDSWLRLTRDAEDALLLDVDGGWGEALMARLQRFKLRTKCDLESIAGWRCLAVRHAEPGVGGDGGAAGDRDVAHAARPIVWPATPGYDLLGPDVEPPASIPLEDTTTYERARIAAGVPALGRELTEGTIPVEAGQWLIDASVSFTKGCFTGQELVARIDSRGGNAPRPVRGVRVEGNVSAGDEISSEGRAIGVLTSAAPDTEGTTIGLAPLSRTVEIGAAVEVGGYTGSVVSLPMA